MSLNYQFTIGENDKLIHAVRQNQGPRTNENLPTIFRVSYQGVREIQRVNMRLNQKRSPDADCWSGSVQCHAIHLHCFYEAMLIESFLHVLR